MRPQRNDLAKVMIGPKRYRDRWGVVVKNSRNDGTVFIEYPSSHRVSLLPIDPRNAIFRRNDRLFVA